VGFTKRVTGDDQCTDRDPKRARAFTLIELLIVIAMIAILAGLLFPAFQAVQNQAKRTQAKNDLTQIVTAVNAFYTEYGKYPLVTAETTYGSTTIPNADLFFTLRAVASGANAGNAVNTRVIVFSQPPDSKVSNPAKAGIDSIASSPTYGTWFDPWGTPYIVRIDGDYSNSVANPYSANAGATPNLQIGVIAWSFGKDAQSQSISGPLSDKSTGTNADDIISWQ
jgi:prepilin-type N-terminal cleavage/methylation domain-containing protein